jgi:hypothetical protein
MPRLLPAPVSLRLLLLACAFPMLWGASSARAQYPSGMTVREAARIDCAFDWAEKQWPTQLTPPAQSKAFDAFYYRYYPTWQGYAAAATDGNAYTRDTTGDMNLGTVANWLSTTSCSFEPRTWKTGFEQLTDFDGFYLTPVPHMGTTRQELSAANVRSGNLAHRAWISGPNPKPDAINTNTNHRGYPTIQLHKLSGGGYRTPVLAEWWVWFDMSLQSPASPPAGAGSNACEWVSFATLSLDKSDNWSRVVLFNQGWEGYAHLMHLRAQGDQSTSFQSRTVQVPQRQWARLTFWLDARASGGQARIWVNGQLASEGPALGGQGILEQAHFGLYADPDCASGTLWNEDLRIFESGSFSTPPPGDTYLPEQPG